MLQESTADAKRAAWVGTGMAIAVLAALAFSDPVLALRFFPFISGKEGDRD